VGGGDRNRGHEYNITGSKGRRQNQVSKRADDGRAEKIKQQLPEHGKHIPGKIKENHSKRSGLYMGVLQYLSQASESRFTSFKSITGKP